MNSALEFLLDHWDRLGLQKFGHPQDLSSVLITPRFQASSRVIFLVFSASQSVPFLVVKMPRLKGADPGMEREASNLQAIQMSRPGGFRSIPEMIAFEEHCDRKIIVETALVGQPLDPPTVRQSPGFYCRKINDWLVDLQVTVKLAKGVDRDWFARLVEEPVRRFEGKFPFNENEHKALELTREIISPLRNADVPLVVEHGDLSHPNILLLQDGSPGVLDWEQAEIQGLPATDLFFWLTYVAFSKHRANANENYLEAFKSAFFGQEAWARKYVQEYSEKIKIPTSQLTPLFILCWLRYILGLLSRLDYDGFQPTKVDSNTASWLRGNRYYKLWRYAVSNAAELCWED